MRVLAQATFPAEVQQIPALTAWVSAHAAQAGVSPARLAYVELGVEELVANVCRYAYAGAPGEIALRLLQDQSSFVVEVADEGPPFDPRSAPEPDTTEPLEDRPVGGLGVMLIRKVARRLTYRRKGGRNVVSVSFDLPPA